MEPTHDHDQGYADDSCSPAPPLRCSQARGWPAPDRHLVARRVFAWPCNHHRGRLHLRSSCSSGSPTSGRAVARRHGQYGEHLAQNARASLDALPLGNVRAREAERSARGEQSTGECPTRRRVFGADVEGSERPGSSASRGSISQDDPVALCTGRPASRAADQGQRGDGRKRNPGPLATWWLHDVQKRKSPLGRSGLSR